MLNTIKLIVGIVAGYGYSITTLLDMMPTVKLGLINLIVMGRL
jgi:hypothetical protein